MSTNESSRIIRYFERLWGYVVSNVQASVETVASVNFWSPLGSAGPRCLPTATKAMATFTAQRSVFAWAKRATVNLKFVFLWFRDVLHFDACRCSYSTAENKSNWATKQGQPGPITKRHFCKPKLNCSMKTSHFSKTRISFCITI